MLTADVLVKCSFESQDCVWKLLWAAVGMSVHVCVCGGGEGGKRMMGEGTCTSVLCFTLNLWPLPMPTNLPIGEEPTSSEQKVYGKCVCYMITS